MADLVTALDLLIREELPQVMFESLPKVDRIYETVIRTSQGVQKDSIGRDYLVKHHFETSLAGAIRTANRLGPTIQTGPTSSFVANSFSNIGFPSPISQPHVGSIIRTVQLQRQHGNFGQPLDILKADSLQASVISQVARDMRGIARLHAQLEAISFYVNGPGYLGTIPTGTVLTDTNTTLVFTPGSSRIGWWHNGMMMSVWDGTDPSSDNLISDDSAGAEIPLIVDQVDYLAGTVKLKRIDGLALNIFGAGANESIVPGSAATHYVFVRDNTVYRLGHYGLETWIKDNSADDGILFAADTNDARAATVQNRTNLSGGVLTTQFDVGNWPQFKSSITANLAAALTETNLTNKIGDFIDAYDADLDTIITTRGVTQKFLEQPTAATSNGAYRQEFDRSGRPLNFQGGWAEVGFTYEGKAYGWNISRFCQAGTLYVIKTQEGNLKRYVPPMLSGGGGIGSTGSGLDLGNEVEFVAPLGGSRSIWKLVHNSAGETTAMVEAPFMQFSQLVPIDVRSIKIGGITESS